MNESNFLHFKWTKLYPSRAETMPWPCYPHPPSDHSAAMVSSTFHVLTKPIQIFQISRMAATWLVIISCSEWILQEPEVVTIYDNLNGMFKPCWNTTNQQTHIRSFCVCYVYIVHAPLSDAQIKNIPSIQFGAGWFVLRFSQIGPSATVRNRCHCHRK